MTATKPLMRKEPRAQQWAMRAGAVCLLAITALACAPKIPNIRPFAAQTASLYQANGTDTQAILTRYTTTIDLAEEILKQSELRLPKGNREIAEIVSEEIKIRLEADKQSFQTSSKGFDAVLQQAVVYSEKLAELAAAGESGAEAAKSLANTINGFGQFAGAGSLIGGTAAKILQQVADYYTRMQARKSLRQAAGEAQEAVDKVATVLKQIHSDQLQRLASSLGSDHDELLLFEAGASITGYYREANERRDQFYRRALLTLRLNNDGISGFCHSPETGEIDPNCINLKEMKALREVEERLAALTPEFEEYQAKRNELRSWREAQRANGERIVKAIDTWVKEHQSVIAALDDGSGVSAFSLQAVLAEIQPLSTNLKE